MMNRNVSYCSLRSLTLTVPRKELRIPSFRLAASEIQETSWSSTLLLTKKVELYLTVENKLSI